MSAIEVHGVSKRYRKDLNPLFPASLKTYFLNGFKKKPNMPDEVVWALQDIDLKITRGATLGIIGGNGSGKSTLLRLMTRILKPDTGTIVVEGQYA